MWWEHRENGKGEQGTGLTYMRWEGLQGGVTLLWVGSFPFREIRLQAWAGLIHRHGPTGPRRLPAFQGRGAGGVRVVWPAGDLIDIGSDLPLEGCVLALQRLQLEETVSNTLRGALSKASRVPWSDVLELTELKMLPIKSCIQLVYLKPENLVDVLASKSTSVHLKLPQWLKYSQHCSPRCALHVQCDKLLNNEDVTQNIFC